VRGYTSSLTLGRPNFLTPDLTGTLNVALFNAVSGSHLMPLHLKEPFRNSIRNLPPQKSRAALLAQMWDVSGTFSLLTRAGSAPGRINPF